MGAYLPPPSYFLNVVELDSMKLIEKKGHLKTGE